MNKLKKFINNLFAIILFMFALTIIMVTLNIIPIETLLSYIADIIIINKTLTIVVSIIVIILAIISLYVKSDDENEVKSGIAIKQDGGTVYLAKDTFESIVLNITKSYAALKNVKVTISISEQGIITNVYAYILPDTIVQTLSTKLQENVKESILKQTTVEIKEVNLKIKGVYISQEKKA